jgi:hypothetical protein
VRDALYLVKLFWRDRYTSLLHEFFASADKKCANALLLTRAIARPPFGDFSISTQRAHSTWSRHKLRFLSQMCDSPIKGGNRNRDD